MREREAQHTHHFTSPHPPHPTSAHARGLESIPLPDLPAPTTDTAAVQRGTLAAADEAYQTSPLLKELKERSETNRASNRRAIENKYCARQAELGIGDCGGLKYVPGATKNGKQKTPGWLAKLIGTDPDKLDAAQTEAAAKVAAAVQALQE